jgi:transposase
MFLDPRSRRIFLYRDPVDMRQGHNGLGHLVTHGMKADLLSGDVFLFVSRDRKCSKAVVWDGSGLCILHKRMERARIMRFEGIGATREIGSHELMLIMGGARVTLTVKIPPGRA